MAKKEKKINKDCKCNEKDNACNCKEPNANQPPQMQDGFASLSITMYGIKKCSGGCLYCSAASTMDYRSPENTTTFKLDKENLTNTLNNDWGVNNARNAVHKHMRIDLWGGNPVENFEPFVQTVSFLKEYFKEWDLDLHTSGNGLELQSSDIVDYLISNNIKYQLSHDGLGQWLRTGEIDPLYWDKTKDNIALMANIGILDAINCTLNRYNYSFLKNLEYFNKWRSKIGIAQKDTGLYIKLNHIYDGSEAVNKPNVFGHWQDGYDESLKGTNIGSLSLRGKVLDEYMHEFKVLYNILRAPISQNNMYYKPYASYILEQGKRWGEMSYMDENTGACRSFQRGLTSQTFVIDTLGNYCECNLIDSSYHVKNPGGYQPTYCNTCRFKNQKECNPCGSENFSEDCEFLYKWCQTLEEIYYLERY